ncbi:hypothetical protein [Streptomyces mutabilis]|uniref:hypothetical protein n=1 Tax=Streptomyces mutabilis TaxID=67332 RepID=UPI0036C3D17E
MDSVILLGVNFWLGNDVSVHIGSVDQSEDQILAGELAALGAVGGGDGRLVRVVAELMRKDVHEIGLFAPLPFDDVLKRFSGVLGRAGRVVATVPVCLARTRRFALPPAAVPVV